MNFDEYAFGSIKIDGTTYEHDLVIDRGEIAKRQKKLSKKYRGGFGHTPLSLEEKIPWKCRIRPVNAYRAFSLPQRM